MALARLDQRIVLQTATLTRDSVGGPVETWVDTATLWAEVRPVSARQATLAAQSQVIARRAVHLRWRAGLSAGQRVRFNDTTTARVAWVEEYPRDGKAVLLVEDVDG